MNDIFPQLPFKDSDLIAIHFGRREDLKINSPDEQILYSSISNEYELLHSIKNKHDAVTKNIEYKNILNEYKKKEKKTNNNNNHNDNNNHTSEYKMFSDDNTQKLLNNYYSKVSGYYDRNKPDNFEKLQGFYSEMYKRNPYLRESGAAGTYFIIVPKYLLKIMSELKNLVSEIKTKNLEINKYLKEVEMIFTKKQKHYYSFTFDFRKLLEKLEQDFNKLVEEEKLDTVHGNDFYYYNKMYSYGKKNGDTVNKGEKNVDEYIKAIKKSINDMYSPEKKKNIGISNFPYEGEFITLGDIKLNEEYGFLPEYNFDMPYNNFINTPINTIKNILKLLNSETYFLLEYVEDERHNKQILTRKNIDNNRVAISKCLNLLKKCYGYKSEESNDVLADILENYNSYKDLIDKNSPIFLEGGNKKIIKKKKLYKTKKRVYTSKRQKNKTNKRKKKDIKKAKSNFNK